MSAASKDRIMVQQGLPRSTYYRWLDLEMQRRIWAQDTSPRVEMGSVELRK